MCASTPTHLVSFSVYTFTKLKRRARLCIYFPLANQMFSFSLFPFFFGIVEHNTVAQAGSRCSAAMQYAFPLSHQNKEIQCLREQRGVSEDVSGCTEPVPLLHLNSVLRRHFVSAPLQIVEHANRIVGMKRLQTKNSHLYKN